MFTGKSLNILLILDIIRLEITQSFLQIMECFLSVDNFSV